MHIILDLEPKRDLTSGNSTSLSEHFQSGMLKVTCHESWLLDVYHMLFTRISVRLCTCKVIIMGINLWMSQSPMTA